MLYGLCIGHFKTTAHYKNVKISKFQCLAVFQGFFQKFSQNALDEWLQRFPDNGPSHKIYNNCFHYLKYTVAAALYRVSRATHPRVYTARYKDILYAKCFLL